MAHIDADPDHYHLFTLKNSSDMTVTISECGATLQSWHAPDRYGRMAEMLLADSNGPGAADVCQDHWRGDYAEGGVSLLLKAAGGAADLLVNYHLDDDGSLIINHSAVAVSLTTLETPSYPYFNLNGGTTGVGDHLLQMDAEYFVETDAGGISLGVAPVGGTPFDFREAAAIGPRLRWPDTQIHIAGGFEHCFFVRSRMSGGQGILCEVARVFDPGSGRRLQVFSTEAGLQFSSGTRAVGRLGRAPPRPQRRLNGFCLKASAFPELMSVDWPRLILHPGQVYRQTTVYRLSLQD